MNVCDTPLRIPMMGFVDSLNAAVAAGILMFELRRQQQSMS
jgi:tRNA G18 (ribose-2'-O)-methylase SpoU